jgi:anti-sigma factor RsiW
MITCRTVVLQLWKLTDDTAPVRHRRPLERHINDCPSCRAYLDGYRLTVHLVRRLHCPPLPERLARRLKEILAEGQGKEDANPSP